MAREPRRLKSPGVVALMEESDFISDFQFYSLRIPTTNSGCSKGFKNPKEA